MERDVIDIVKEKEFIELSDAERAELAELCSSEEEFNQMKAMFTSIGGIEWSNPTPRVETKESLDHLFAQKYPKAAPVWYNAPLAVIAPKDKPIYRQPLIQVAAIGLLVLLAYPFVKSTMITSDSTPVAALEKEDAPSTLETEAEVKIESSDEQELKNELVTPVEEKNKVVNFEAEESEKVLSRASMSPSPRIAPPPSDDFAFGGSIEAASEIEAVTFEELAEVSAIPPGSDHPDGIFIGDKKEIFSIPASHEPAVFDLLTSTF